MATDTEDLPVADEPPRRRRRHGGLWLLVVVLIGAAAVATQQRVFHQINLPAALAHPHHPAAPQGPAPGCSPRGLALIWRVEYDADTLRGSPINQLTSSRGTRLTQTSAGQLEADAAQLQRLLVNDPRRWRFTWVIRSVLANTVGGRNSDFEHAFAQIVNSEPRC